MDELLWLFAMAAGLILVLRWLLQRGFSPISRQAIRQLFVERLLATIDSCQLLGDGIESLTVQCQASSCSIHFTALYRRCAEFPFRTIQYVREAVEAVRDALADGDRLPEGWERRVVPLLVSTEVPAPPDLLLHPLTESLQVGYAVEAAAAFRWITRVDLIRATIQADQVRAIALGNLERSCSGLVIEAPPPLPDGRDRLLRFHTLDGLDAARALLPSFYQRFAPRFGDVDMLVAIPTRDSLIAIPATDQAQASFLQWRAEAERRRSARPLSTQLLQITESGVNEWIPGQEGVN